MPLPQPTIPAAAAPIRKTFDPWNSSSTGHQRADNRLAGSTSWRQSRTAKLASQFRSGAGGGKRMFDSVGAGNPAFGRDGRKENGSWEKGAKGLREDGWRDVGLMMASGPDVEKEVRDKERKEREGEYPETRIPGVRDEEEKEEEEEEEERDANAEATAEREKKRLKRGVFQDLAFYINGSTGPMVSDHRLKQILAENGGRVALGLARRSVTHVIVGRPNGRVGGAGGGLSGSKIEKEIQRVRGCGVKFVSVEWVLDSLEAGKKLPEHKYEGVRTAPSGVGSVVGMFKKQEVKEKNAALVGSEKIKGLV